MCEWRVGTYANCPSFDVLKVAALHFRLVTGTCLLKKALYFKWRNNGSTFPIVSASISFPPYQSLESPPSSMLHSIFKDVSLCEREEESRVERDL
jgi:hypothetical protein